MVPILKGNGSIRLSGDYKVTVNREVKIDTSICQGSRSFMHRLLVVHNSPSWTSHMPISKLCQTMCQSSLSPSMPTWVFTRSADCHLVCYQLLQCFYESWKAFCKTYKMFAYTLMISLYQFKPQRNICKV